MPGKLPNLRNQDVDGIVWHKPHRSMQSSTDGCLKSFLQATWDLSSSCGSAGRAVFTRNLLEANHAVVPDTIHKRLGLNARYSNLDDVHKDMVAAMLL